MRVNFDIETEGLIEHGSGKFPRVHCIVISQDGARPVLFIGRALKEAVGIINSASEWSGHNIIGYDIPILRSLGLCDPFGKTIYDTTIMSKLCYPDLYFNDQRREFGLDVPDDINGKHKLSAWGHRLTSMLGISCLKGEYGRDEKGNVIPEAFAEYCQEMGDYCVGDVTVQQELLKFLLTKEVCGAPCLKVEHDFALNMAMMQASGFPLDTSRCVSLVAKLSARRQEIDADMFKVFPGWDERETLKTPDHWTFEGKNVGATVAEALERGYKRNQIVAGPPRVKVTHVDFNPGSRHHIAKVFKEKYEWEPLKFGKDGWPCVDEDVLEDLQYPEAKFLTEYLMLKKRLGQISEGDKAWLKLAGKDGRVHGGVNTLGAVSGRCTFSDPNMGQVPAVDKPYGPDCRACFVAPPGMVIVGFDASGIQLRSLSHYLYPYDKGAYAKVVLEGDVHTHNQLAAGLPTRENAKTFIYAWLMGAAGRKIGSIVGQDEKHGRKLIAQFLRACPAIKELRDDLKRAAQRGYIKGIDGRQIPVLRSDHTAMSYLMQSFEVAVMKQATVWVRERLANTKFNNRDLVYGIDWQWCAHVYDEDQLACKPELAEMIGQLGVQCIADAGVHLKSRVPLTGEYKVGANWADTH